MTADLNLEGAEATSAVIRDLGRRTERSQSTSRTGSRSTRWSSRPSAALGSIDIAFNVPGINIRKLALEMTPDEFRQVIDVNLIGVFHCARAIGAVMVRQGRAGWSTSPA